MINFCHTCKFSTLTINFSEVWPRQILDLEKQLNQMIRLENVLKTSLQDVLKMSSKSLEDVLKISWRRFCKTSWRRFEDVFIKTNVCWVCSPKLSLENWILHCLRENFPEYPRDITIRILMIVYSIPQHFPWFESCKLYWFWNLFLTLLLKMVHASFT